jgi:hypothetical protein
VSDHQHKLESSDEPTTKEKGGLTVEEAGHKDGQRVKELVEEGKEKEEAQGDSQATRMRATWNEVSCPVTSYYPNRMHPR